MIKSCNQAIRNIILKEDFITFILTEKEPLTTREVVNWGISVSQNVPLQTLTEIDLVEEIGEEVGFIIEDGLWVDVAIAVVESRISPISNDKKLCEEILETNNKKASERRQMEWNFDRPVRQAIR